MPCRCDTCDYLSVWPEMPYMDPPNVPDVWTNPSAEWTVACHWLGPLIDGRAALIRRKMPTDGGSIPQAAWSIIGHPFQMPGLPSFLTHDGEFGGEIFSRSECDERLLKSLLINKVDEAKSRVIYDFVRLGGGVCWGEHTPELVARYRSYVRIIGEERWHALAASRIFPYDLFAQNHLVLA